MQPDKFSTCGIFFVVLGVILMGLVIIIYYILLLVLVISVWKGLRARMSMLWITQKRLLQWLTCKFSLLHKKVFWY